MDTELPAASRAEEFLRQVKNPYAFKCGEFTVDIRYTAGGKELEEALVSYLGAIKGES